MKFALPVWLYVGLAICSLLALFFWWSDRRRRDVLRSFVSQHLLAELTANFSPVRRLAKRVLFVAALACFFIALARPQYGHRWQEVKRKGVDVVVAVDVSRSMLTQDVKPSRLERAKLAVRDLVKMADGDRLALIPFAGSAYVMCPPTLDYDVFLSSLDSLSPELMPLPGTDIATAMQAAEDLLGKAKGSRKILILLTDGEDLAGSALAQAKRAAAQEIVIYTVGIGTPAGDLIPVPNANGGVDFLKDEKGQIVKSRLDETMLKKIAEITGGSYALQSSHGGVEKIYGEKIQIIPNHELSSRMEKIPLERFVWPLTAGILLLVMEFLLRERKSQFFNCGAQALTMAVLLAAGALLATPVVYAEPTPEAKDYKEFSKLAEKYKKQLVKRPDDVVLNYDYGTASYKLGHYETASNAFQKALGSSDLRLENYAYYNYGGTLYRRGEQTEKSDPDTTRKFWRESIQAYQNAVKLNPADKEAEDNIKFVQKRLNELPPPQNQEQQDNNQQQQQNQQDQQQQGNKEQNQNNQSSKDKQDSQGQQNQQNKDGQPQKSDANDGKDKEQKQPGKPDQNKPDQQPREQPGGLSKEQAQAALDALKGEERPYNVAVPNFKSASPETKDGRKDW